MKLNCSVVAGLLSSLVTVGASAAPAGPAEPDLTCRAELDRGVFTVQNGRIRIEYAWNDGNLAVKRIVDTAIGRERTLLGEQPDLAFPGVDQPLSGGKLETEWKAGTNLRPGRLEATVTAAVQGLEVRRIFRVYPNCPAIACDLYVRGVAPNGWREHAAHPAALIGEKEGRRAIALDAVVTSRLEFTGQHWRATAVAFREATDNHNTLVTDEKLLIYKPHEDGLVGNLLFLDDLLGDGGIFVLKEAPDSGAYLDYPGADFVVRRNEARVIGLGVTPDDVRPDEWTRAYGVVTGVMHGGELGRLDALRDYQERVRVYLPQRDEMVVMNTWGDRNKDAKLSEPFILAELEAGARLGISRLQIDMGWQTPEWTPRADRFPNGFAPLAKRAKELDLELGLWFVARQDDGYARWQEDISHLEKYYKEFGMRTFKFDSVEVQSKRADVNLRRLFDGLMKATNGEAVVNLDMTASKRFGYFYMNEYGSTFLENRYTDGSSYYPHWTLRNLWMLSRYVPPQNFQMEFLNKWRNPDKYAKDDPLAPQAYPFDYVFALTMPAQPLAWLEASGLPEEAFEIAPLVKAYRALSPRLHATRIFPIGDEPSGTGWTGFQFIGKTGGWFLVFREWNDKPKALVRTWLPAGKSVTCKAVLGHGADFSATVDENGAVPFGLEQSRSFALYEYTTQ